MAAAKTNPTDVHLRTRLTAPMASRNGTGDYQPTPDDIAYARLLTRDPCSYCGSTAGTLDHIDPDENGWQNLTAACKPCNISKGHRSLLRHTLAIQLRAQRDELICTLSLLQDRRDRTPQAA